MSITISEMSAADCKAVAEIESECFSEPWSEEEFEHQIPLEIAKTYIAKDGDRVIGFINVWVVAGEIQLNNIAVTEDYRGQGIGRRLITFMESKNPAERCNLEVRISNQTARGLYLSLGFEEVGLRKEFYRDPVEDAVLMTKYYGESDEL